MGNRVGFWDDQHFDFEDALNSEAWRESPARGARLVASTLGSRAGGWQDRWANPPLPWVPDLVGKRWRETGSVIVVGSAYAPFVGGAAQRHAAMSFQQYATARDAGEFGRRFLAGVVHPDASYYRGLSELLGGLVQPDQVVLTDLCRTCFVEEREGAFVGGDAVVQRHRATYDRWVDAGADWLGRRLDGTPSSMIVVLGELAFRTLERVAADAGTPIRMAQTGTYLARKSSVHGVLVVVHPSRRNQYDHGYAKGRRALAMRLGRPAPSAPVIPPRPPEKKVISRSSSSERSRTTSSAPPGSVIGLHFVCRGRKNVRKMDDGTYETGVWVVAEQHARTAEYVALHETKAERSYLKGRILSFRSVVHDGRTRLVFRIAPEGPPLAWVGDGAGEKGYRYR